MSDEETPRGNPCVEVSVGWNSSSPKRTFQFPDSPGAETPQRSQQINEPSKSDEINDQCDTSKSDIYTMSGMLGKYSSLLPGSSPPRPRMVVRKRKPESPLRKKVSDEKYKDIKLDPFPAPQLIQQSEHMDNAEPLNHPLVPNTANTANCNTDGVTADAVDATYSVATNSGAVNNGAVNSDAVNSVTSNIVVANSVTSNSVRANSVVANSTSNKVGENSTNHSAASCKTPASAVANGATNNVPVNIANVASNNATANSAQYNASSESEDSDFEALIKAMAPVSFPHSYFYSRKIRRYVVQRVEVAHPQRATRLEISCTDSANQKVCIHMQGSWADSKVRRGDTIHLFSPSQSQSLIVSDENDVMAVINPDILVPCTSVAESLSCERQVVLKNQVRVPADLNENLVLGSIKHEFIQMCFTNNLLNNASDMQNALKIAVQAYSLDLQLVGLDAETAVDSLKPMVPTLQKWAMAIWGSRAHGQQVPAHRGNSKLKIRLNRSITTEEEIRSPYLGLVGKIDVTAEASDFTNAENAASGTTRLAALEIKTGRGTQSITHRAQAALYTLLLAERHPNNTHPWSLLYYTVNSTVMAVMSLNSEMRALFQKRNMIAYDLWQAPTGSLPIPLSASDMSCKWCSRQDSCVLYTAIKDSGNSWDKGALSTVYQQAKEAGKLTPKFMHFIEHWQNLIQLEYETASRYERLKSRQWWITNPNPVLWGAVSLEDMPSLSHGFTYTMTIKSQPSSSQSKASQSGHPSDAGVPFVNTLVHDERVIISSKQHMGVTFGVILENLPNNAIKIWTKDKLLMSGKYRIDSDPWVSDMHLGLARFNLDCLMENDRLRELLVDLIEPKFSTLSDRKFRTTLEWASSRVLHTDTPSTSSTATAEKKRSQAHYLDLLSSDDDEPDKVEVSSADDHSNLNEDQTMALNKVLGAKDYALILGMPGTGKTTTIAAIVASLVKRGKSVLVTAYTNSAVDTIVLKLLSAKVPCLRLAASLDDLQKDVIPAAASTSGTSLNVGGKALTEFLESPVIACTSHLTGNKLFALRQFDYCILDEASQITLPFCIGPLRLASTFALVGDHYQLPPLVRNSTAKELGLSESLFKILCEAHPQSVVELTKQYRMCADIMSLSSDLVYNGRLVCGTESVASQKLHLPYFPVGNASSNIPNSAAIDPDHRVVFLDTDPLGNKAHEIVHTQGSSNATEGEIIRGIVAQFSKAGLSMSDVAVISVYRKQLMYVSGLLRAYIDQGLEVLTADQAQGRDKKCILVSLVRSNEKTHSGELLKDWRRLNVAFTRAKQKLVIVGSKRVMKYADGVARFFEYIENRGWVHGAQI